MPKRISLASAATAVAAAGVAGVAGVGVGRLDHLVEELPDARLLLKVVVDQVDEQIGVGHVLDDLARRRLRLVQQTPLLHPDVERLLLFITHEKQNKK